jgi:hypothetical protein
MADIDLHIRMGFNVPKSAASDPAHKKTCFRLVSACDYLSRMADEETMDQHHLADMADAIESIANIHRRARAAAGGK